MLCAERWPPKCICWRLDPQCAVSGGSALRRYLRLHEVISGAWPIGQCPYQQRYWRVHTLSLSYPTRSPTEPCEMVAFLKLGQRPHQTQTGGGSCILDFPASELWGVNIWPFSPQSIGFCSGGASRPRHLASPRKPNPGATFLSSLCMSSRHSCLQGAIMSSLALASVGFWDIPLFCFSPASPFTASLSPLLIPPLFTKSLSTGGVQLTLGLPVFSPHALSPAQELSTRGNPAYTPSSGVFDDTCRLFGWSHWERHYWHLVGGGRGAASILPRTGRPTTEKVLAWSVSSAEVQSPALEDFANIMAPHT